MGYILLSNSNLTPAQSVTGNFNVDSGVYNYTWTGNAIWTGILPGAISTSGFEFSIKNKSQSFNLFISGNVDNQQNIIMNSLENLKIWSDGQTWNII